jgi:hypothetical protein
MTLAASALRQFVDRLTPMLPADFAEPVQTLDLARPKSGGKELQVCRFWSQVMAGDGLLLTPLASLGPVLDWVQNPNYVARPPGADFLANYGYAVLAGPGGLVASDRLALGILMLGPGTHYPTHRHPAVEIYVVAAGEAEWRKGDAPWRRELPHATRTLGDPLLAVYVWRGDLMTYAKIAGN